MSQYSAPYPLELTPEPTVARSTRPPRVLFLYGSLRERSYSRLLAEEAARIMAGLGAEVRFFDPRELPVFGSVPATHPKVQELRQLSEWSETQVWSTPKQHGAVTGVMKNQIDWIPLSILLAPSNSLEVSPWLPSWTDMPSNSAHWAIPCAWAFCGSSCSRETTGRQRAKSKVMWMYRRRRSVTT
jgi:hypothetical protein